MDTGPHSPVGPRVKVAIGEEAFRMPELSWTSQICRGAPSTPVLAGKLIALPAIWTWPGGTGRMSVVAGSSPVKNLYCSAKDSGAVTVWVWPKLGKVTLFVPIARPGTPCPQIPLQFTGAGFPGQLTPVAPSTLMYLATRALRSGELFR